VRPDLTHLGHTNDRAVIIRPRFGLEFGERASPATEPGVLMMPVDNPFDLSGQRILVTGASSGIGRCCAVCLSQMGASLVLVGRSVDRLEETRQQLVGDAHEVESCDLARHDVIPRWMRDVTKRTGPLNGIVHGAGIQKLIPLRVQESNAVLPVFDINVFAAMALARGFRQRGVAAGVGSIVFISSVMACVGAPGLSAYGATKGAIIAMTKSLAVELASENVRVNCVCPGQIETEMSGRMRSLLTPEQFAEIEAKHPLGIGRPLDVAWSIVYLMSPAARWVTGTALVVDGGYTAH